ncbi:MAG: diguanylate cyclase, partial [Gammaproteobacteria bacterium]
SGLLGELVDIYTRDDALYARARRWRFDAVVQHGPTDAFGNAVITVAIAAIFAGNAAHGALIAWLIAINGASLVRLVIWFIHQRAGTRSPDLLQKIFSASLVIHAALWATSFFLFAPADSIASRSAVLVWLAGCAAWVVSAYTLLIEAVLGFLLVQLTPLAVALLLSGDRFWQLVAIAIAMFLPTMAMVALRNNALLMRGTITALEKEQLVEALEREKGAVERLNDDLEADIERREQIEAELRAAMARAEELTNTLERLSSLDGLTGIANRRRFDQMLAREWSRAHRGQWPLALILCDLDYFKQYNDHYGHQAGDACLRQLAQLLERSLRRGGDLAARYGGEEFAILLPETDSEHAAAVAEGIRDALLQLGLPHERSLVAPVLTASFGVAALVPDGESAPEVLVEQADKALYAAKASGRNRVRQSGVTQGSLPFPDSLLH